MHIAVRLRDLETLISVINPVLSVSANGVHKTYLLTPNVLPYRGRGNSIMVIVSICEAGRPGSSPARSVCILQKDGDLLALYQLVHTSAEDWFNKGVPCVIMSM